MTLRASSDATVASRVWSITRKPRSEAIFRTSPRATAISRSFSSAIDLLSNHARLPVELLLVLVRRIELRAQELEPLVNVQHCLDAFQFKPKLYERDGDRRLHSYYDGSSVHDARHRRNVREHAANERVNHFQ